MREVPKVGEGTSHIEYQIRRDNRYSMREVPKVGEGTSHIEYQIREGLVCLHQHRLHNL